RPVNSLLPKFPLATQQPWQLLALLALLGMSSATAVGYVWGWTSATVPPVVRDSSPIADSPVDWQMEALLVPKFGGKQSDEAPPPVSTGSPGEATARPLPRTPTAAVAE